MRVFQQPAFVLHTSDYRETSLLVEAYSRNHGRIGLIAKGARRAKTGLRAVLNPFQPLLLSWSGKSDLATLTAAEPDQTALILSGEALYCGFYLNELLMRLLHRHDPHERLFDAYRDALGQLQASGEHDVALRIFEKRLLQELGYGPVLDHEVGATTPIAPDRVYEYLPERGPVPVGGGPAGGVRIHGRSLLALAAGRFSDAQELREAKRLMRSMLAQHLGERPLYSRELFQRLKVPAPLDKAG
ncbi:MAG: DNA repair protein RecO [Candidatus Muproteobacteria bacterium RBG_16_64_11]|uniref:DNA repair protein RecO n=1 Tax=Candidatus Muproteobacteria bacterium RBG_16_64_11 TaxID=1817758 RepID=A0A1F6TFM9_9PROT|nr:MAG: DNA repair protein RecO [Candidatus Muproteobacteria bacterium RBG_16_64_11]